MRLDPAAVDRDVREHRLAREVVVPDAVVHALEMPEPLARLHVERDQALSEQVRPGTMAAVPVVGRRRQRQVDMAELLVAAHRRPDVDVSGVRPGVLLPRLVAHFAGPRDGAERPQQLARAHVIAPDVAWRRFHPRRASRAVDVANHGADDDDVSNDRWRRTPVVAVVGSAEALPQVHPTRRAEPDVPSSGRGIERHEIRPDDSENAGTLAVGPVRKTSSGGGGRPSSRPRARASARACRGRRGVGGASSTQRTRPDAGLSATTVPFPALI